MADRPTRRRRTVGDMDEEIATTDLINAWRDAAQAADLADRLAHEAHEASERADGRADVASRIAILAEATASAAQRAAVSARDAAGHAAAEAQQACPTEARRTVAEAVRARRAREGETPSRRSPRK